MAFPSGRQNAPPPPAGNRRPPSPRGAPAGPRVDKNHPVAALLGGLGLCQYTDAILRNGFDDIETLLEIEDADMQDLGVAPRDAAKLRRRLQEMRGDADEGQESPKLDGSNPVVSFLRGVSLGQYAEVLVQNGFDDMETLAEIEDGDLKDLGIPRGHQVKLKIRLKEYEEEASSCRIGEMAYSPCSSSLAAPYSRPASVDRGRGAGSRSLQPAGQANSAVLRSWDLVQELGVSNVGDMVKNTLFAIAPHLLRLFPQKVTHKYREWTPDEDFGVIDANTCPGLRKLFGKVVAAVGRAVAGFHDPARMVPMLTALGVRHAGYGASPEHWDLLGEALNHTLKVCLSDAFTPEVEAAWTTVYRFVASVMIEGLRGSVASRASVLGSLEAQKAVCSVEVPKAVCGLEAPKDAWPASALGSPAVSPLPSAKGGEDAHPVPVQGSPAAHTLPTAKAGEECEPSTSRFGEAAAKHLGDSPTGRSCASSEVRPEPEREETPGKAEARAPVTPTAPWQQVSLFSRIREAKAFWQSRA